MWGLGRSGKTVAEIVLLTLEPDDLVFNEARRDAVLKRLNQF
jgi:hypothetical protein